MTCEMLQHVTCVCTKLVLKHIDRSSYHTRLYVEVKLLLTQQGDTLVPGMFCAGWQAMV